MCKGGGGGEEEEGGSKGRGAGGGVTERRERQRRLSGSFTATHTLFARIHCRARRRTCSAASATALVEPFQHRDSGKMLSWGCLLALSLAALTGKRREKSLEFFFYQTLNVVVSMLCRSKSERRRKSVILR